MAEANTLAYHDTATITGVKSFMVQSSGVQFKKGIKRVKILIAYKATKGPFRRGTPNESQVT